MPRRPSSRRWSRGRQHLLELALGLALAAWIAGPASAAEPSQGATTRRPGQTGYRPRKPAFSAQLADPAAEKLFLQPIEITLGKARPGINPVPKKSYVIGRRPGLDVLNVLLVRKNANGVYTVTLREQSRVPEALRGQRRGLPGGSPWTLSDSTGETIEAGAGYASSIFRKLLHGLQEELKPQELEGLEVDALPEREVRKLARRLFQPIADQRGIAFSPDRSVGVANLLVLLDKSGLTPTLTPSDRAPSGEIAEDGARIFRDVPITRALQWARAGYLTDGRTVLMLHIAAHRLGIPISPGLAQPLGARGRRIVKHAIDPHRRRSGASTDFSRVKIGRSRNPHAEEWHSDTLSVVSRTLELSSRDGSRASRERFEHKVAQASDQVSELPIVRGPDGKVYVVLIPSFSVGPLARREPWIAEKTAGAHLPATATTQLRGIVRDVRRYSMTDEPRHEALVEKIGGNLRAIPSYRAGIRDARRALAKVGLEATRTFWNDGQYNASGGENGFHMNLIVREYTLDTDTTLDALRKRPGLHVMPLDEAIAYALAHPRKVDQMTQLQLFQVALRERDTRIFNIAKR